jgi:TadE-like protein
VTPQRAAPRRGASHGVGSHRPASRRRAACAGPGDLEATQEPAAKGAAAGRRLRRSAARGSGGAALVEFAIVMPVALLLTLGTIQFGVILVARQVLEQAVYDGARRGALHNALPHQIRRGVVAGLAAMHQDLTDPVDDARLAAALGRAALDAGAHLEVERLSPSPAAFVDFARRGADGSRAIPNDHLEVRSALVGAASGLTIQQANVLRVRATWGYALQVPLMAAVMRTALCGGTMGVSAWGGGPAAPRVAADAGDCARYYLQGRVPLVAVATVHMQSAACER